MTSLPPQPGLRTALCYLHSQAGGDFFSDTAFSWSAGELRQQGLAADVVHAWFPRGDVHGIAAVERDLLATLGGYDLAVLDQVWDPGLVARIQRAGTRVVATDPFAVQPGQRLEFELAHFLNHRAPLLDLVQTLVLGGDLTAVANLTLHLPGMAQPQPSPLPPQPYPLQPQAFLPFCPVVDAVHVGVAQDALGRPPPVRKTLDTNTGCPFAAPVERNPAFADVPLQADGVTLRGCSFCFMGGDYRALPVPQTVALHVAHVAYWQANLSPPLQEVVLRDQAALRYLPDLAKAALAANLAPIGWLLPARGDAILRYGDELAAAARLLEGSGHWFTLYLIGFESFAQAQLDLYNKGVTVAEYAEALHQMRDLHARHPDTFRMEACGASSFILFNPWTTLQDLQENVEFCQAEALLTLAHGLTLTRLRLYPNLPLYWKAKQDGLLHEAPTQGAATPTTATATATATTDRGAAATGYSAEATWRYRDERVAAVEDLQRRLARHAHLDESVGLLATALAWVQQRLPEPVQAGVQPPLLAEIEAIEREWQGLRALWQGGQGRPDAAGSGQRTARVPSPAQPQAETAESAESAESAETPASARTARTALLGTLCNNRCRTCVAGHGRFEADPDRQEARVVASIKPQSAEQVARTVLAGREPTLLPHLPRLVRAARKAGATQIELVSNGRMLATPGVAARLQKAGTTDLLLKRHRLADADEDAFAQADGAGAQFWLAIQQVQATRELRWTLLLVLARGGEAELPAIVAAAADRGARAVQAKVLAAEVDLGRIAAVRAGLLAAAEVAAARGMRFAVEGF